VQSTRAQFHVIPSQRFRYEVMRIRDWKLQQALGIKKKRHLACYFFKRFGVYLFPFHKKNEKCISNCQRSLHLHVTFVIYSHYHKKRGSTR
jgi:hypothetical protein